MQKHHLLLDSIPTQLSKLVTAVAGMIHAMKIEFIKRHLSRHVQDYEQRTAGSIVLNYMMMLPLGLTVDPGMVLYPHFAVRGHSNPLQMSSSNVITRYLTGGTIFFEYNEIEEIPPLNLFTIATR